MPVWTCNKQLAKDSEIVIFDLDGVISDASHRQHFLKGAEKDWDGFFSACTEAVSYTHLTLPTKRIV